MRKAFIIHGAYGNSTENWSPWLKNELEQLDYEVIVPTFPTPEEQSLENWNNIFNKHIDTLDKDTILVGHSLGCPFILNILQSIDIKINSIYLVAGFHTLLDHPIDEINKTFVEDGFDWTKIKNNYEKVVMLNGDNDPYIKKAISDELAEKLDATYEVIPDGGHLNSTAGYTKFEKLLSYIKGANL
jgi:uncharacterized protein